MSRDQLSWAEYRIKCLLIEIAEHAEKVEGVALLPVPFKIGHRMLKVLSTAGGLNEGLLGVRQRLWRRGELQGFILNVVRP